MIQNIKDILLWVTKFLTKFLFQSFWPNYNFWKKYGFFEHGKMEESSYAKYVFYKHFDISKQYLPSKLVGMEIGPGDELSSYNFFKYENFKSQIFIDKKKYASQLVNGKYKYFTKGIASFRFIEDKSVSYIFANSVFQHISRDEVSRYFDEINRTLVKGGVISLVIDFKDMINAGLFMHLVPDCIWHSHLVKNKLFYTNRLLFDEYEEIFKLHRFCILEKNLSHYKNTNHVKLVNNLCNKKESSLLVSGCHYVLKSKD